MKSYKLLLPVLILTILCTGLFFGYSQAHADQIDNVTVDQKNDFVLEPGKAEIFLNPGDVETRSIYVTDRIPGITQFKVEVDDIEGSRDPNQPVVILQNGDKSPNSGKDFIIPDTQTFSLSFGQRITIPVKISIPNTASPGGYYSSVLISNEPSVMATSTGKNPEGNTKIISRVGTLFFVRVNGTANESGNLDDFRINGPQQLFYEKGPFTFEISFNNNGNVHLVPYGTIEIKNIFGKPIDEIPVDAYFSLPNSLRYRDVVWNTPLLLGRYTATLHLNRGYNNQYDDRTIVIWVLPWKILAGIFIGILILTLIIIFFLKNFEVKKK